MVREKSKEFGMEIMAGDYSEKRDRAGLTSKYNELGVTGKHRFQGFTFSVAAPRESQETTTSTKTDFLFLTQSIGGGL